MAIHRIPRGIRNNNPLNIRKGCSWRGEKTSQVDTQFEEFESIEFGLRAAFILLRNYMSGNNSSGARLNTVSKIVSRWAPAIENATDKYIDFVAAYMGISRYSLIRFEDAGSMCLLVQAMAKVETGETIPLNIIKSAYYMV